MKWKVTKLTHKYVAWQCFCSLINVTFSYACAQDEDVQERRSITPHIINPAPLHTMPLDNILVTNLIKLTFLFSPQDFIRYQMEQVTFTHYISWYPYFYGLLVFSITYPHSFALYVCVWSASHYTCTTLGKNAEYQLNRRLDRPEIWPGRPDVVKNLLTLPGT